MKTARYSYFLVPMLMLGMSLFGAACMHTPIGVAQSDVQLIQATYATVAPVAEAAADVVENANNPLELRRTVQCVLVSSRPVFETLKAADHKYDDLKAQLAKGTTTQDQLNLAITELHKAEGTASIPFNTLVKALARLPVECGA